MDDALPQDPPPVRRTAGRPRANAAAPSTETTRDEILNAAARLFGAQGFLKTTTRQIASEVGIRQASLYYHFSDKVSILRALFASTVEPSLAFADWIAGREEPAAGRLYALARFDLDTILNDTRNLHLVLDAPDEQPGRGSPEQQTLRRVYRELTEQAMTQQGVSPAESTDLDLPFGLVEGLVAQRHWGEITERGRYTKSIARGVLRLVGVHEEALASAELSGLALIDRYRSTL